MDPKNLTYLNNSKMYTFFHIKNLKFFNSNNFKKYSNHQLTSPYNQSLAEFWLKNFPVEHPCNLNRITKISNLRQKDF